jgi:hypothetical protein
MFFSCFSFPMIKKIPATNPPLLAPQAVPGWTGGNFEKTVHD